MFRRLMPTSLLLFVFLAGCQSSSDSESSAFVGTPAPPLEGVDLEGKPFNLTEHRGKVVVVDFWATWCPPCVRMIPHEKELVKRMQGKKFVFVSVSVDENRDKLEGFVKAKGMNWINIHDADGGKISDRWKVTQIPTFFVIDKNGNVRAVVGPDASKLDRAIDNAMAEVDN